MTARRTLLITGCSSGIGYHCAHAMAARGWRVFATARDSEDVERLAREGLEALALDLNDSWSIHAAVDEILARTGGSLDALFNNGAYGQPGAVEDLTRSTLRAQFETNVFGWLELTNRILPAMRSQGHGRIVQNSSVLGLVALKWRGAYNASKYAVEGLTDTLRLELAGSGVHVSLIEPGPITSRFRENALEAFDRRIDSDRSPHSAYYERLEQRRLKPQKPTPFTLGPEAVHKRLVHALESRRPRRRYPVTFPTYVFATLRRVLPASVLDRILARASD